MFYLMKSERAEFGQQICYRHGRALHTLQAAIEKLQRLPINSEVRNEHNNLVALKTKSVVINLENFFPQP